VGIANALALIGMGIAGADVQEWQSAVTVAMLDFSLICFAVDALVSRSQAQRLMRQSAKEQQGRAVSLSPVLSPVYGPDGVTGGTLGLGGTF
jgi:hypothetical protein